VLRGTAQNPDVFFQAGEACNPFYRACPQIVQDVMDRFARQTGRSYHLFDYVGAPDAERVVILMGSGAGAAEECVKALQKSGERVGFLKVRLYKPFALDAFFRGSAHDGVQHCRARPNEGTRHRRRAPLSRGSDRFYGASLRERLATAAAHHRRALWALFEGIYSGDGEGRL